MSRTGLWISVATALLLYPGCGSQQTYDGTTDGSADPGDVTGGGGPDATSVRDFVGTDGGAVRLLHFGAFSDSQPPEMNQDGEFPTTVVESVFTNMSRLDVQFVVGAGDWSFANTREHVENQLSLLLAAEAPYGGVVFHAMGNHDCKTASASNCPYENESPNVVAYKQTLLPFKEHSWFSFNVRTSLGTAKFVFTSTNAWDDEIQGRWLESVMRQRTEYTFVVQHASDFSSGSETPGAKKALDIIRQYPVTLSIYGHAHMYKRLSANELIIGNGGASLNGTGQFYGFAVIDQLENGDVRVNVYDRLGNRRDAWTIGPTGIDVP